MAELVSSHIKDCSRSYRSSPRTWTTKLKCTVWNYWNNIATNADVDDWSRESHRSLSGQRRDRSSLPLVEGATFRYGKHSHRRLTSCSPYISSSRRFKTPLTSSNPSTHPSHSTKFFILKWLLPYSMVLE